MKKKITIAMRRNKSLVSFDGFAGNMCYEERAKLEKALSELGIGIIIEAEKKKDSIPQIPDADHDAEKIKH